MATAKQTRLNEIARSRGYRNYYEERTQAKNINLGTREGRSFLGSFLRKIGAVRNKSSLSQYQQVREKMHINIPGNGTREVTYHGDTITWDEFAVRRGIVSTSLTEKGEEEGVSLPTPQFDPGEEYDDFDDYYDVDFDEFWDEYEFG